MESTVTPLQERLDAEVATYSLQELGYKEVPNNCCPERAGDGFHLDGYTYRRDERGQLFRVKGRRVLPREVGVPVM
ncbi:MAG TPA: hypothetical protein VJ837_01870 [Candidatus Paceibacterota bacterium]|nr:hypothetical protein [Candidatus Paceibacterota bacterium]